MVVCKSILLVNYSQKLHDSFLKNGLSKGRVFLLSLVVARYPPISLSQNSKQLQVGHG